MRPQELLIVTRRFWPHCGLTEMALADLARNLNDAGHRVTVATIKWSRDWSDHICFHDIPVIRFTRPLSGPWSSFRYARSLAKLLAGKNYDGVIASGLGDEAIAASRSADDMTAVVVRIDDALEGIAGQLHRRHVETCLSADAVVTNSLAVARRIAGLDQISSIAVIPDGVRIRTNQLPSKVNRQNIRAALSFAHPVLKIEPDQPLAVSNVRMNAGCGLNELVQAWPRVLSRFPAARLWLIGDGPQAGAIWQQIIRLDLTHSVIMPGFFDELDDLLIAADVYIHPCQAIQSGEGLLRAMAVGTPVIATEDDWTASFLNSDENGLLVPAGDEITLAHSIIQRLTSQDDRQKIGARAMQTIATFFRPDEQADKYLELLTASTRQSVVAAK